MRAIASYLLTLLAFASAAPELRAATYYIDAFAPGGIPGTGGPTPTPICTGGSCAEDGYRTPAYIVEPGDVVHFGTVTLHSFVFCDGRQGPDPTCGVFGGNYAVSFELDEAFTIPNLLDICRQFSEPLCSTKTLPTLVAGLSFIVPDGATRVQVAWTGPYTYALPTPLPGALPLFITTLGTLGAYSWLRRHQ